MSNGHSPEVPDTWLSLTIGEIATFGRKPASTLLEDNVQVSFVPMTCVEEESGRINLGQVISATEGKRRSLTYFEDGDVLFAKITPCMENGKVAVAKGLQNGAAFGSSEFYVLRPQEDTVLPEYLKFVLVDSSFRSEAARAMTGAVGQQRVPRRFLEDFKLGVPPVSEQREIVRILEEQFSRLDAAAASIAAVRRKADQFRRSTIHNELQRLPAERLRLDECATMTLGMMLDKGKETGHFQTPYLGNINVRWGSVDTAVLKTMDIRPEQMERGTARAGDIVVCEGGEPGRCAIWRESKPIGIQKALHRVRPHEQFLPEFIALILESEFRGRSQHSLFTGTTIKHLPKEKLRLVKIPNVSRDEQERVVSAFRAIDDSVAGTVAKCMNFKDGMSATRRALLHAAFSGELTKEWRNLNNG